MRDSIFLEAIAHQKGGEYYEENWIAIVEGDGINPLQPEDPYFPHYLPEEKQVELVLGLAWIAILKKNLALFSFEEEKAKVEKFFSLEIDKPVGICSHYAGWLIENNFFGSHTDVHFKLMDKFSFVPAHFMDDSEKVFMSWIKNEAVKIPELREQAELCKDAVIKDLLRMGGNQNWFMKGIYTKVDMEILEHPTAYTKSLFGYYNNNVLKMC